MFFMLPFLCSVRGWNLLRCCYYYLLLEYVFYNRKVAGSSPDEVDFFQFTQSLQPHYGPGVDSTSNRNEYQEASWGVKRGRRVRLTTLPPSMSRLSRRCGSLDLSHPYKPSRPLTGIALLYFLLSRYPLFKISQNPRMSLKVLRTEGRKT
jgi:hypothetical protein